MTSRSRPRRLSLVPAGVLLWIGCLSVFAQQQGPAPSAAAARSAAPSAATPSRPPPSPASQPPAGRGRPGAPDPDAAADFSPKPPIKALTPEEQAARFILPPGYRHGAGALRARHRQPDARSRSTGTAGCTSMRCAATCSTPTAAASSIPSAASACTRARRETAGSTATRSSSTTLVLPRFVLPLDGRSILTMETQHGRHFQVHRHERRRRRGEEGALLQRRRPPREPRASAERVRVGARQLDLQHLQRLPLPMDARRNPQGADRAQLRPVGVDAGRQRQDVVRRCRR